MPSKPPILVRNTRPEDFNAIIEMGRLLYPDAAPWPEQSLRSHIEVFPQGQFVAVELETQQVVGMAASLVVRWDDYDFTDTWRDFTSGGTFENHDPSGQTLYGADVMVHPRAQGLGAGKRLYTARRHLANKLNLLRIRAGARLVGYGRFAQVMPPAEYVIKVIHGQLGDPTLSFQLKQGFHVLGVVSNYIRDDPQSKGYAAIIQWLNPRLATAQDYAARNAMFLA